MVRPTGPRWTLGAWRGLLPAMLATLAVFGLGRMTPAAADPAASAWFVTEQGSVRLIAAAPQTGAADTRRLGLEFRLAPGWKIYWRAPGDAGLPPHLDWAGSRNLAKAEIAWPAPQRFSAYGLETIGYEDAVILPISARLEQEDAPLSLRAALEYLTCKDICIPYEGVLSLDLPAGGAESGSADRYAELIERYARQVPGDAAASGIELIAARIVPGKSPTLELSLASDAPLIAPDAFIEAPAGLAFGAPRVQRAADRKSAILDIAVGETTPRGLDGQRLRITIVDGARSLDRSVTPNAVAAPREPALLLAMLGVALLGGFMLNFMPCVLPVLSVKLLAVASHAGRPRAAIRRGFLASAAGIVSTFLLLAAAMLLLKAAGLAVGWGLQFQHPAFLVLMTALLTLFAYVDRLCPVSIERGHVAPGGPLDLHARSDFGRVLEELFAERALLTRTTLLLVLGDARNNRLPPRAPRLRALRDRVARIVWLVPEPRARWDTGDSVLGLYGPACAAVLECTDLAALVRAVRQVL